MGKELIRWGIIGCGNVTEKKSGPAFNKVPNSRLVAVMRRDAHKAADYAKRHNVPRWYDNAQSLINDPEVDAIYIATPPGSHALYTILAARSGKAVYVEKPMARTHAECREMIDVCRDLAVPLYVAYYRRRLGQFLKVRELIDSRAIGTVRLVNAALWIPPREGDREPGNQHWHVDPQIAGGGYVFDVGSHLLDILDFLISPIDTVKAITVNQAGWYKTEDASVVSLGFESGAIGSLSFCFTSDFGVRTDRVEILGSSGSITFSTFGSASVYLHTSNENRQFDFTQPEHIQQPLIETVVNALLGRGKCPSTGESAARTSLVLDQIAASLTLT